MSATPTRILIVRLSHLGDVVHALPVFHALRAAHPDARIAWAIQPEFAPLLDGLPGLERTILFQRRRGALAWVRLAADLEAFGADWSIDCQANTKSAMVALAARAPRRSGLARADWREPFAAGTLTDPAPPLPPGCRHAVDRMLHLAGHAARRPVRAPCFDLGLSAAERAQGERRCSELLPGEGGTILHLAPASDVRAWPAERFEELARAAAERADVLVISGPAEAEDGRALAARLSRPRVRHWTAQRGLRELAAVFHAAAARGARFVGCDSGPMHLAWTRGLPVVLLAGPQDARRTGPWPADAPANPDHRVVRAAAQPDCAPCRARTCAHPEGPVCMRRIRAEDVLGALT